MHSRNPLGGGGRAVGEKNFQIKIIYDEVQTSKISKAFALNPFCNKILVYNATLQRGQFTQHFTHIVMNFMKIHYNEFKIKNVNNKKTLSELRPMLLTKQSA